MLFRNLLLCLTVAVFVPTTAAQTTNTASYTAEELRQHFQETAEAYEIDSDGQRLSVRKAPLMNWKNPIRTQSQGAMYAWEKDGLPEVLGSIFTYEYNDVVKCRHELISMAEGPLTARLDSDIVWAPTRAGVEWTAWDPKLVPAESAPRRLFQMRSIARQFTGTLVQPDGGKTVLTLIPQPLLRYEAADRGVIDGAVFSLAMGTDPEILLAIQCKRSEDESAGYRYAPLRANYMALFLELNGTQVWSAKEELAYRGTRAGESPWASGPFFPMTPNQPLPPPGQ